MKLYEIDAAIESLYAEAVDPETGEISEEAFERLDALQMERAEKIENVALWHKNALAESKAIGDEIEALRARKKALDAKLEWQKGYLSRALSGEKFETPRVAVTYRKSEAVTIDDEAAFCEFYKDDDSIVTTSVKLSANKTNLKKLLKSGVPVVGASLVERLNIQIK